MKIREIDIENFGIFTDRHFDFGESPFQLIHGPNEAGKSTLLHLLRQILFGFPTRSPYQFETHSGEMAARALIDVADGRRVSFRRRKGRSATVVGEVEGTTEKIDEAALNGILGNANIDLYQHVFGFSLTELSRGEESLKHANLNEAMFGGSLGSPSNLQEIQKSLEDEAAGLFKSGNAAKPVVNSLLREIRSRNTEIKNATLKPRDFEDKQKVLREEEERVASLSESREEVQKELAHVDRLCQAVEPWLERKAIQDELEQIKIPAGVTAASGAEMQQLLNDLARARSALSDAAEELAETELTLKRLKLSPEVVKVEARIRSLEKDFSRVQRDMELLPQRRSQSQTILADVKSQLADLNPDWDLTYLDTFQSSLEQREKLDELATLWSELERRRTETAARLPDLKQRVNEATARLAELAVVKAIPEVDEILERESAFQIATAGLEDSAATETSLNGQLAILRKRLAPALANPMLTDDELAELPVPLESLLRSFQDRHAAAESALASAESRCQQESESLKKIQAELAATTAADQVPDRFELEEQRERRDA
ncbi:MAG: AAA family ATPase, partial [Rhodopirellula sp.]|nr:AAA family ATPase [Rhodopirellula sp.]